MSVVASAWAWSVRGAGPMPKLVLAALADQADDDGWCWPSQAVIAERCEMGERTVRRHIATLRDLGLLTPVARSSTWGRRSNGYQLHVGAVVDADGEDSLESRQPANLAGCEGAGESEPVDNSGPGPVFVGVPATGQSGRLRKRPDWPVAQEATTGRSQPANVGRLLPIKEEPSLEPPDQTRPRGGDLGARDDVDGPVGSGPAKPQTLGQKSRTLPADRLLVAECLPESMRALDAAGMRRVVGLLEVRVEAGWSPAQIRSVMDQPLPPRVGRLASLVAKRLELNVDPAAPPVAGSDRRRLSEEERHERSRRRSEELAGTTRRRAGDELMDRALAHVRREAPSAGRAEQIRLAAELVRSWRQDAGAGQEVAS